MKVTVNSIDPDYTPLHKYVDFVTVDGSVVKHCISADDTKGEVWCYEVDENGKILPPVGDAFRVTILRGKVEIHFKAFQIIPSDAFLRPKDNRQNN